MTLLACLVITTNSLGAHRPLQAPVQQRISQSQVAMQFLRAVIRGDYGAAYGRLAPEVRRSISLGHFEQTAHTLWKSGQRHHREIELYKLGVRLNEKGGSRLFYAFSFAADSCLKTPSVLLEVSFRDTASRAVLGFGVNAPQPGRRLPAESTQKPTLHR